MCRRARPDAFTPRSYASVRSTRISEQSSSRDSTASARPTRARTSSDLTAGDRGVERGGEVGIGHAVDLAHEQGGALLLGEAADVGDEPAQVVTALGLLDRVVQRLARHLEDLGRRGRRAAQLIDAAVVRDPVEPRADVELPVVGAQGAVGPHEDVLQHVLGVLPRASEHLAGVGEEPLLVAVHEHGERVVGARAEQGDELVVGAQPQQRPQREAGEATCSWGMKG
jgi:hypothetical protein